ncbi:MULTISPECIES: class I SAM-dependent methyltransferase [unclassified Blastococcus]
MNQHLTDRLQFLRAFLANPRQVGAILPTSRWAVRDMLDLGDVPNAKLVVELGAGTGSQTGELLARLGPEAELVAVEIDPALAELLAGRYRDPRLHVVCDSAENLAEHLDGRRADVVVSALPYTSFSPGLRRRILDVLPDLVAPDGAVLVIQYSPLILGELRRRFARVNLRISPWNVPPAVLFACREPREDEPAG